MAQSGDVPGEDDFHDTFHADEKQFYYINCIKEGTSCSHAEYITIRNSQYVVMARNDHLAFTKVFGAGKIVEPLEEFRIYTKSITALATLQYNNEPLLVTFDVDNTVSILDVSSGKATEIIKLDPKGHQQAIDSSPILVVDPSESNSRYIILHCFQGHIHLLYKPRVKPHPQKKRKRKHSDKDTELPEKKDAGPTDWVIKTVSIGTLVVQKMVALSQSPHIAIMYRDFNFNHSLRLYKVNEAADDVVLLKQFAEFDAPPSLIIPTICGGLLVLTGAHLFYFGEPGTHLALDNSAETTLSINTDDNVITQDFSRFPHLLTERFLSYTVVDANKILLVSNTGMTYVVYIETQKEGKLVVFRRADIIKLGRSTIPIHGGLFHIHENSFFQISKFSRSVLFQVLPDAPHINISSYLESSPSILDITVDNADLSGFNICHGGYNSSEYSRLVFQKYQLETLASFKLQSQSTKLEVAETTIIAGDITLKFDSKINKFTEINSIEEISSNSSEFKYKIKNKDYVLSLDSNERLIARYGSKTTVKELGREIVSIDSTRFGNQKVFIWLTLLDNTQILCTHSVEDDHFEDLILPQLDYTYLNAALFFEGRNLFVISPFAGQNGVSQLKLDIQGESVHKISEFHVKLPGITGISKGTDFIVICDSFNIYHMKLNETGYFAPYRLNHNPFLSEVNDVKVLKTNLLILQDTFSVHAFRIVPVKEQQQNLVHGESYRSPILITKALILPGTEFSVILSQETKLSNDVIKKYSYLELVMTTTLEVVNRFSFPEEREAQVVDICVSSDETTDEVYLLALDNGNSSIYVFKQDEDNQFFLFDESKTLIPSQENLSLQTIGGDSIHELRISGSTNFSVEYRRTESPPRGHWSILEYLSNQTPIFAVAHASTEKLTYYADVRDGIYYGATEDPGLERLDLVHEHRFVTSLDATSRNPRDRLPIGEENILSDVIVSGDSFGNLSVCDRQQHTILQRCAFNIGEQINIVKMIPERSDLRHASRPIAAPLALIGTVNGGIYKLSRIPSQKAGEKLSACFQEILSIPPKKSRPGKEKLGDWDWRGGVDGQGKVQTFEHFGIIDHSIIERFLAEKSEDLFNKQRLHQSEKRKRKVIDTFSEEYPKCTDNEVLLQKVAFAAMSPWEVE